MEDLGVSSKGAMIGSNDKLSFIFLCDGPCTASSWRNEDKSMYWARRDALARISAMSLWQGPGNDSCISDDCSLLFHEAVVNVGTDEKEDLLAAIAMTGPQLVSALPIPTESSLICRWKAAATVAIKYPQQAEIGNVQVKALRLQKVLSNILIVPAMLLLFYASTFRAEYFPFCVNDSVIYSLTSNLM